MPVLAAFREGIRRVNGAPLVLAGVYAATLLVALPLSIVLRGTLEEHLGRSLVAERVAAGTDYDWWQELGAQASGLGATFAPSIIGFGAVLDNLSGLLDNQPLAAAIAAATVLWMVVWSFLSGGILDRYARARPTRGHGFFAACGTHFWRFLRLGILALAAYYVLFAWIHDWLFTDLYGRVTRDITVERSAFTVRSACYLVFGALLIAVNLVVDYTRVRIVVEDRRSAIGALVAAVRFIGRNKGAGMLYLLNGTVFLLLVLLYALAAPGAPGSGWAILGTLAAGQVYILGRHYVKLLFYASQTAFFQSALAHAAYTAGPPVVWPDSPAAEAVVARSMSTASSEGVEAPGPQGARRENTGSMRTTRNAAGRDASAAECGRPHAPATR